MDGEIEIYSVQNTGLGLCIIFLASYSEIHLVTMTTRAMIAEDIASLDSYSHCIDMTSIFGDHECAPV